MIRDKIVLGLCTLGTASGVSWLEDGAHGWRLQKEARGAPLEGKLQGEEQDALPEHCFGQAAVVS